MAFITIKPPLKGNMFLNFSNHWKSKSKSLAGFSTYRVVQDWITIESWKTVPRSFQISPVPPGLRQLSMKCAEPSSFGQLNGGMVAGGKCDVLPHIHRLNMHLKNNNWYTPDGVQWIVKNSSCIVSLCVTWDFNDYRTKVKNVVLGSYLDPPRGAKWMLKGPTKQPLRVQTPCLGECWYVFDNWIEALAEQILSVLD